MVAAQTRPKTRTSEGEPDTAMPMRPTLPSPRSRRGANGSSLVAMYRWVIVTLVCPARRLTSSSGTPLASRNVQNPCRNWCGVNEDPGIPAATSARARRRFMCCGSMFAEAYLGGQVVRPVTCQVTSGSLRFCLDNALSRGAVNDSIELPSMVGSHWAKNRTHDSHGTIPFFPPLRRKPVRRGPSTFDPSSDTTSLRRSPQNKPNPNPMRSASDRSEFHSRRQSSQSHGLGDSL